MENKGVRTVFLLGGLPKPRIEKRINIALKHSSVSLICWDKSGEGKTIPDERYDKYIYPIKSSLDFATRIKPYFEYKKKAIQKLNEIQPDILHTPGLHMAMIGYEYYKHAKKKPHIIYEVPDLLRMVVEPQNSLIKKIAQKYFRYMEKKCCKVADALVITSEKYYDVHFSKFVDRSKVFYFPNVPDLTAFESYEKTKHENFTVGFIGVIRYKRELINLIQAADELGIRLLIAGDEIDGDEVENALKGKGFVERIGRFNFSESAAQLYEKCDVIYSVYNADLQNCRIALPNKLYESIYCELPIIVAKDTYLSDLVEEMGVGVSVDHTSLDDLISALKELMLYENYSKYVKNCRLHKDEIDLNKFSAQYIEFLRNRIKA